MTDPVLFGERILTLLETSQRTATYKPALLLALIDGAQEHPEGMVPVRTLAERVIELYWQQTLPYEDKGVLLQNQRTQAVIVRELVEYRQRAGVTGRVLPDAARRRADWPGLVDRVERTLAEWPIPRLQDPAERFIYEFDWTWAKEGGWSTRRYAAGTRCIHLEPGVRDALVSLGPLLRPFITRWWADKAAQLNLDVEDAQALLAFEDFLFGRDRVALGRVAESLLDLQGGACFYCSRTVASGREVDHFVPWSHSGDDGLDNLVAACGPCNNAKRALLPGVLHVGGLIGRNRDWDKELRHIAEERSWPRNAPRSIRIMCGAYERLPDERPLWSRTDAGPIVQPAGFHRAEIDALLATVSCR